MNYEIPASALFFLHILCNCCKDLQFVNRILLFTTSDWRFFFSLYQICGFIVSKDLYRICTVKILIVQCILLELSLNIS